MSNDDSIAVKIRSGEYFREARRAYADLYLDPMAERYFYMLVTIASLVIFCVTLNAMSLLYPLAPQVPFVYMSQNIDEELPNIISLRDQNNPHETPNFALKRYLVSEYVRRRETYDIDTLEMNVRVIHSMSNDQVYSNWQKELDPSNPESPIAQFERHTKRTIQIQSATQLPDNSFEVSYAAVQTSQQEQKIAYYTANIAFRFAEVAVDQTTGRATPIDFVVTGYQTRRIEG